jgi:hypothetical protein
MVGNEKVTVEREQTANDSETLHHPSSERGSGAGVRSQRPAARRWPRDIVGHFLLLGLVDTFGRGPPPQALLVFPDANNRYGLTPPSVSVFPETSSADFGTRCCSAFRGAVDVVPRGPENGPTFSTPSRG